MKQSVRPDMVNQDVAPSSFHFVEFCQLCNPGLGQLDRFSCQIRL